MSDVLTGDFFPAKSSRETTNSEIAGHVLGVFERCRLRQQNPTAAPLWRGLSCSADAPKDGDFLALFAQRARKVSFLLNQLSYPPRPYCNIGSHEVRSTEIRNVAIEPQR